jgi:hypothetical protein
MKHTHKGTCQICGATQAVSLKNGTLALHGYTTRWGFFSGTCSGSRGLPYEQSVDLIESSIAFALDSAEKARATASELRARTGNEGFWTYYEKPRNRADALAGRSYITVPCVFVKYSVNGYDQVEVQFTKRGETEVTTSTRSIYSSDPMEVAAKSREAEAKKSDEREASLRDYANWQQARITGWQPSDLIEVAA